MCAGEEGPNFEERPSDNLNTLGRIPFPMRQTTIRVTGMSCGGCERNVTSALESLEGVSSATASHADDRVRVEHDDGLVDETALGNTIEDAGYEVEG